MKDKLIMVYAFYGMGKTTLANEFPKLFADLDECYIEFGDKSFEELVEENKDKCILTNKLIDNPTLVFLPKTMDIAIKRLKARGVPSSFTDELVAHEQEFYDFFEGCKVIYLEENEYLINYLHSIIKEERNYVPKAR